MATWNRKAVGNSSGSNTDYPSIRTVSNTNFKGPKITQVRRGEQGYPILNLDYPLQTDWDVTHFYDNTPVYPYVIFEYDPWPAGQRTAVSLVVSATPGEDQKVYLNFRSADPCYGGASAGFSKDVNYAIYGNVDGFPVGSTFSGLFYNPYVFTSGDIDFRTERY